MNRKDFRPIKTVIVPQKDLGEDYIGMNYYAGKELRHDKKYDGKIPPKTEVYVSKDLSRHKRKVVARHELIEQKVMRNGVKYKKAHQIANRYEKI